ncbi:MAG: hypothetical protein ABSB18_06390 [Candidatus Omnitrophota bacterium]
MNIDKVNERIWCHVCYAWICALAGVLLIDIEGQDRKNVFCDRHESWIHLGYDTDWPELYRQGAEDQT